MMRYHHSVMNSCACVSSARFSNLRMIARCSFTSPSLVHLVEHLVQLAVLVAAVLVAGLVVDMNLATSSSGLTTAWQLKSSETSNSFFLRSVA